MSTKNTLNNTAHSPSDAPAHSPADWQEKILAESKGPIRFTPKNDYMFKAICQSNTYALEGLLAALLGLQQEEISELKILNPIQLGATANEKDCVLDVKLRLNNHQIINIEMQVLFQSDWVERSLVYLCRTVSGQLKPGESYGNLLRTVHIGILDFNLFEDNRNFHSVYHLTDTKTGHIYTGKFTLSVVNLKQINHATKDDVASGLKDWARLFQATTWEEMLMITNNNESMRSFTFSLKELSEDEKIQMQCEARERYEHDKASFIQQGIRQGIRLGIEQEQGKLKEAQGKVKEAQGKAKEAQERIEAERQRAEVQRQLAETEKQRAEAAEAELSRLRAELASK